jgi:hypothetical protein
LCNKGIHVSEDESKQIDAVRGEVAEDAVAAAGHGIPPPEGAARMRGIVGEELDAGMGRHADRPLADDAAGARDGRYIPVVEPDAPNDAIGLHGIADGLGVGAGQADRLLDPQVLPRFRDGDADLAVEKVGGGDADRGDVRVGEHRPPVLVHRDIAVGRGEGLRRARNRLGHGDDPRTQGQVRPMLDRAGIRPGMNVTHPAGADDGDGKFGDRHKHSWSGSRDDRLTGGHWHMF